MFNLKKIENMIKYVNEKYGRIISFELSGSNKLVTSIWSVDELLSDKSRLSYTKLIRMSVINENNVIYSVSFDVDKNSLNAEICQVYANGNPSNSYYKFDRENDMYLINTNETYYLFDQSILAKYNSETGVYYVLDENKEWVENDSIISWIYGSNKNCEIINNKKGERKL